MVSHLSKENSWMVKRVKSGHTVFGRVLCFRYVCRAQVGRNKPKKGLSKKEFAKVIERNRERGFYDSIAPMPTPKKTKPISKDTLKVVNSVEPIVTTETQTESTPKADSLITLNEFLFEVNSFKLKAEHLPELDVLSEYLLGHPTLRITISGHTDNTGDENKNMKLSAQRAKSVAEYLENKGVTHNSIKYQGLGSSQPVEPNNTESGRSKNRRVEILIQSKQR